MPFSNAPLRRPVLLLSPYFPPRQRVGAFRLFKLAIRLREHGYEPIVACLATPKACLSASQRAALADIRVLALQNPWDRTDTSPLHHKATAHAAQRWFHTLADAIDDRLPVDGWLAVLWWHWPKITRFATEAGVRAVIATADPWSSLVVGAKVSQALNVPLISDLRDPWMACEVRNASRPRWVRAIDDRIEQWVFSCSSRIVFSADEARRAYGQRYPKWASAMKTVENGYDSRLFCDPVDLTGSSLQTFASPRTSLDFLCFGKFRRLSPARAVIAWLAGAVAKAPHVRAMVRIQSMGPLDWQDRAEARARGVLECFEQTNEVPYEQALTRQRQADALLVTTDEHRRDMIPAKLFDALASGRPIVALTNNPDVGAVIRETGRGLCLDPCAPAATELLLAMIRAKAAKQAIPIAFEQHAGAVLAHDADEKARRFARLLDEVVQ